MTIIEIASLRHAFYWRKGMFFNKIFLEKLKLLIRRVFIKSLMGKK